MARDVGAAATLLKDVAGRMAQVVAAAATRVEALVSDGVTPPDKLARSAGAVARAATSVVMLEQRLEALLRRAAAAPSRADTEEAEMDDDDEDDLDLEDCADQHAEVDRMLQRLVYNLAGPGGLEEDAAGGAEGDPAQLDEAGAPRPAAAAA